MKVLIVDDNIDLRVILSKYFQRRGFSVCMSHTLQDGLAKIHQEHPDIVVLDNNLPDSTGWKEAPALAAQHPDMMLLLISAFNPTPPYMPQNSNYRIIEKPLSFSHLDSLLNELAV